MLETPELLICWSCHKALEVLETNFCEGYCFKKSIQMNLVFMKFYSLGAARLSVVFTFFLLNNLSLAQEVVVEEFTPGTTISSASVNSNFGKLAEKANTNGSRISSVEAGVSSIEAAIASKTLNWLGYTTTPFDSEGDYDYVTNGYTLSAHCKSEFGPTASVASDLDLEVFIRTTGDFTPPSDGAYVLYRGTIPNHDNIYTAINPYFMYGPLNIGGEAKLYPSGLISSWETNREIMPVACVSLD